jgi:ribosomal protein L23
MTVVAKDAIRFAVHIGEDIVRVVRQDDYDIAAAIAEAFRQVKLDGVNIHTTHRGDLRVFVERVR